MLKHSIVQEKRVSELRALGWGKGGSRLNKKSKGRVGGGAEIYRKFESKKDDFD